HSLRHACYTSILLAKCYVCLLASCPRRSTLFPYTTLFRSWLEIAPDSGAREVYMKKFGTAILAGVAMSVVMSVTAYAQDITVGRSEEHTSELQSRENLVCRLLLEKKKTHMFGLTARIYQSC